MNNGKTLVSTYYALKDYIGHRKIITNYNINIPHYEVNKDFLEWMAEKQPETKGMSFFFDELWLWLDSRNSMSNRILTYFFLQSSKGDTQVYLTTQRDNQLDSRVRENSHIIIKCERKILYHNKMISVKNRVRDLGKYWYPYIYIKVKEYENKFNGIYRMVECDKIFYLKADWLFKFYDTNQKMKYKNQEIKN